MIYPVSFLFFFLCLTSFLLVASEEFPVFRFYHGKVLRNHEFLEEELWIRGSKIIPPQITADFEIDLQGNLLAPGFIDLQINGAYGVDFSRNPEDIEKVSALLPKHGVTSFLATIISSPVEDYPKILSALSKKKALGAQLLGLHLEGPFLNPLYAGAHDKFLLRADLKHFFSIISELEKVKIITLAPELPDSLEIIKKLISKGIIVFAGHTDCDFDTLTLAEECGITGVTHLFNAMRPFHHRDPGLITKTLLSSSLAFGIIADGFHVNPHVIQLAWKANPEGLFLVTDAMEAMGLPAGVYQLGHLQVEVNNGKALLAGSSTLAGSLLQMDQAVRNFFKWSECTLSQALEAASLKPARVLGIDKDKGHLEVGADADLVILNDDLEILETYVLGQKVYEKARRQ